MINNRVDVWNLIIISKLVSDKDNDLVFYLVCIFFIGD